MLIFLYVLIGILGAIVGSFLTVVIDRIPKAQSIIFGRSHCDHCHTILRWIELIPVLSFFLQGGKCRHCKKTLSIFYPIIESITAISFLFAGYITMGQDVTRFYNGLFDLSLLYLFFIFSCLIVILFIDYKYGIIPFKVVIVAISIALLWYLVSPIIYENYPIPNGLYQPLLLYSFGNYILSAVGVFIFFYLLFAITKGRGMGFGDVVYAVLMGFLLGFPRVIVGLYFAFLTGAVISLILVLCGKKKLKGGTIPFGPFLVGGTMLGLFWGQYFINFVYQYLHG